MLPRCYLMANGPERSGQRGLLSWVLAVSLPRKFRHNLASSEGAPPPVVGEGVFSRAEVVLLNVRPPSQAPMLDWAQSPPLLPGFSPDPEPEATLHCPPIWK